MEIRQRSVSRLGRKLAIVRSALFLAAFFLMWLSRNRTRSWPQPSGREALVERAREALAQRLDLDPDKIEIRRVEATEFADTSLGVPETGRMYAQVITPGYIIELHLSGTIYTFHGSGSRVVFVSETNAGHAGLSENARSS